MGKGSYDVCLCVEQFWRSQRGVGQRLAQFSDARMTAGEELSGHTQQRVTRLPEVLQQLHILLLLLPATTFFQVSRQQKKHYVCIFMVFIE